jgi:uncharacterized protein
MDLSAPEIRVLGCLLEKQRVTPDVYPLSLNSLRLACNQSTNRDPVVSYDEAALRDALHRLERRGWVRLASGAGSRAAKYRHLLAEALPMGDDEQAVMCVLMLRGPQTPGELKQRTERMHPFVDLGGVHETLERLIGRDLVAVQPRRPGQKEERYLQLLGGEAGAGSDGAPGTQASTALSAVPSHGGPSSGQPFDRQDLASAEDLAAGALAALEERVVRLEHEVTRLRTALESEEGRTALAGKEERTALEGEEGETLEWT